MLVFFSVKVSSNSQTLPQLTSPSSTSNGSGHHYYSSNGGKQIKCQTTCKSNGSCMVKMINGPPGPLSGTCLPPPGTCSGIPHQCQKGRTMAQQCGIPCQQGTRNV